jgi:hypothetical protein
MKLKRQLMGSEAEKMPKIDDIYQYYHVPRSVTRKIDEKKSINRVGVLYFTLGFFLPNPAQASIASCQIKTETDDRPRCRHAIIFLAYFNTRPYSPLQGDKLWLDLNARLRCNGIITYDISSR